MHSRRRFNFALLLVFVGLTLTAAVPRSTSSQQSPEQQLVDRYAPVAYLRDQEAPCDRDGEGYFPAPVESVLGNPDVALKKADSDSSETDSIVKMAPTAADIAGLSDDYYLDFPGNPRRPGCTFETDFKEYAAKMGLQPSTYARVVVDPDSGRLVIQYWLWYYFNDWNNLHEGDWEIAQVVFEATSVEEALASDPILYAYAQHGGGELGEPGDNKVHVEEDRPVVYPAAGSHATHFEQHLYLGWGENGTGFGCDNSTPPATRVPLKVILIPDNPDPAGPFGWTTFGGRWGERQPWEFNGPRSPNLTNRWANPVTDMEEWRDSSLVAPASNLLGPDVTGTFCTLSQTGSVIVGEIITDPLLLAFGAIGILAALAGLIFANRIELGMAIAMYRRNWKLFLAIGAVSIPIGVFFDLVRLAFDHTDVGRWLIEWTNPDSRVSLFSLTMAGSFRYLAIALIVVPACIVAIRELQNGDTPKTWHCYHEAIRSFWNVAGAALILGISAGLSAFTIVGLVLAIWLLIEWQFYAQAILLDGAQNPIVALTTSMRKVKGRWTRTLAKSLLFQLLVVAPGPLIGLALLIVGGSSPQIANLAAGFIYAVAVPFATIGLTRFYQAGKQGDQPTTVSTNHSGNMEDFGTVPVVS